MAIGQFIQENWVYIALIIAVIGGLIRIGIWVGSTNKGISNLEKSVGSLEKSVGSLEKSVGSLKKSVSNLNGAVQSIRGDIRNIQEKIVEIFGRLPPLNTTEADSPIRLTEKGREISEHLGAKDWAKESVDQLLSQTKDKEEFEIFDICSNHVDETFKGDDNFNRKVRSASYDYGYASDNEQILIIFKVELRDEILNIQQSNVQ